MLGSRAIAAVLPIRGVGSTQGFNLWLQELSVANRRRLLNKNMSST